MSWYNVVVQKELPEMQDSHWWLFCRSAQHSGTRSTDILTWPSPTYTCQRHTRPPTRRSAPRTSPGPWTLECLNERGKKYIQIYIYIRILKKKTKRVNGWSSRFIWKSRLKQQIRNWNYCLLLRYKCFMWKPHSIFTAFGCWWDFSIDGCVYGAGLALIFAGKWLGFITLCGSIKFYAAHK